jgi:hypothetical protein
MRAGFFALFLLLASSYPGALFAEGDKPLWSHGWTGEGAGHTGLQLFGVSQLTTGLQGHFVYYNTSEKNDRTQAISISGTRSTDGTFWPDATLQVRKMADSDWETIGKATGKGQPETINVAPNDFSRILEIEFDPFEQFITTHKRGRVIISSGATAEFSLKDLTIGGD